MKTRTAEQIRAARAAYMRAWYARNAEKCKKWTRRYARKNRAKVKERRRRYYQDHKEEIVEKVRVRRRRDPLKAASHGKAQAANRRYPGRLTAADVLSVIVKSGRKCCHCGKKNLRGVDLTLEHLKPINDVRYLAISCHACNVARIPHRGPRKSEKQKRREASERSKAWAKNNRERHNARWWAMTPEQREKRREYTRRYMRKRRGTKKSAYLIKDRTR
jgi:hypothetical protein